MELLNEHFPSFPWTAVNSVLAVFWFFAAFCCYLLNDALGKRDRERKYMRSQSPYLIIATCQTSKIGKERKGKERL